jgi:hypothetical protein
VAGDTGDEDGDGGGGNLCSLWVASDRFHLYSRVMRRYEVCREREKNVR